MVQMVFSKIRMDGADDFIKAGEWMVQMVLSKKELMVQMVVSKLGMDGTDGFYQN